MNDLDRLVALIERSKRIACLTGAGMSTESGIPDFRSPNGLYNSIPENAFNIYTFARDPGIFYRNVAGFAASLLQAKPNSGHRALWQLEQTGRHVAIATQNIDSLHQRAGSSEVYELHGTFDTFFCCECGEELNSSAVVQDILDGNVPRHECGGILRPNIVFFDELLPDRAMEDAMGAMRNAELVLVLGTSLNVFPAAILPTERKPGTPLVIVNQSETDQDDSADLVFHRMIGEFLSEVVQRIR